MTGRRGLRLVELGLGAVAAGIAIAAALPLSMRPDGGFALAALRPALMLVAAFAVVHIGLCLRGRGADQRVLPILLALTGIGLAFSQRLAPALAGRQWWWVLAGVAMIGLAALAPFDLRLLQRYRYSWAFLGIALVSLTLVAGQSAVPGGPRLWLAVGGFTFQPSEALKLLVVFFLAGFLEDKREILSEASLRIGRLRLMPIPYLAPLAVMLGLSLALLFAQRDLGAALLLFSISLGMLYLASARPEFVAAGLAVFALGAWLLHHEIAVVQTRVAIWRDPWSDPSDTGYQLIQGLMAVGAGGIFGTGIGQGLPTAVPAVHTDFIFAAIVEEIGLAGAGAILLLYGLLFMAGFRIAIRARTPLGQLLAAGLTFGLAIQTLIILGGVLKLIPLTGVTLPFMSHGGTSMLVSGITAGLLLRISAEAS